MLFNLLLKTQHFAIPLSVSITKPKILVVSPFLRMIIKPGKSRKCAKPTSEKRGKINGLKVSKIEMNGTFFIEEFFSRALEISRQLHCASSNYSFFTQNIQLYHITEKVKRSYECPKQWLSRTRFKNIRFLNKCATLSYRN